MTAQLTVVAPVATLRGGHEPGEVDGQPVPAVMVRRLAHALGLLPRTHPDPDPAAGTEPEPADAPDAPDALDVSAAPGAGLAGLLGVRTVAGTALAGRPRLALVDELSGQLLALTDAPGLRRAAAGQGLGPPAESPGYAPAAPLRAFVRARDRRCRFPGCRAAAIRCDLDHTMPWPAGRPAPTTCAACAATTTGSATRRPAGGCATGPTAAWNGPPRAATGSPPTRRPTAPTTTHHPNPNHRRPSENWSSDDHTHPAPPTPTPRRSDAIESTAGRGTAAVRSGTIDALTPTIGTTQDRAAAGRVVTAGGVAVGEVLVERRAGAS